MRRFALTCALALWITAGCSAAPTNPDEPPVDNPVDNPVDKAKTVWRWVDIGVRFVLEALDDL